MFLIKMTQNVYRKKLTKLNEEIYKSTMIRRGLNVHLFVIGNQMNKN